MDGTVYVIGADSQTRQSIELLAAALGCTTRSDVDILNFEDAVQFDKLSCVVLISEPRELTSAMEWASHCIHEHPMTRIIVLGCDCDTPQVVHAMRLGISSVLEFPFLHADLESAIRLALEENQAILMETQNELSAEIVALLTKEEQEIARMLIKGAGTKQISVRLDLSVRTIHYRKKAMFRKLGLNGRVSPREALLGFQPSGACAAHDAIYSRVGN
jgi:DNA-binding NarL/FixJ family response regulator